MTFKHENRTPPVIWAIIADRSRGRVFSAEWPNPSTWELVDQLAHDEGALKPGEVNTDRQGSFASAAGGYHAGEDRTDFRHQSAERFAADVVERLEAAREKNEFGKLAIVAPPLFLGVLRKKLPSTLAERIVLELDKDYTQAAEKDVTKHLQQAITEQERAS